MMRKMKKKKPKRLRNTAKIIPIKIEKNLRKN
jgi:hypothetical protein